MNGGLPNTPLKLTVGFAAHSLSRIVRPHPQASQRVENSSEKVAEGPEAQGQQDEEGHCQDVEVAVDELLRTRPQPAQQPRHRKEAQPAPQRAAHQQHR